MIDTSNAPTKAAEKVLTLKPFITVPKNQNSAPFITRENNPSVTIFKGRVKILSIGFINMLNNVKQAPTMSAVTTIGCKEIPDTIYVVAKTETESIIQCKIIFIYFSPPPGVEDIK